MELETSRIRQLIKNARLNGQFPKWVLVPDPDDPRVLVPVDRELYLRFKEKYQE